MSGLYKTTVAGFTGYLIGDERFKTKDEALKKIHGILYGYELDQVVSEEDAHFLFALLQNHQHVAEKIGCGIASFRVRRNLRFAKQRNFVIVRLDGSETDFSFVKCLTRPSPKAIFLRTCRLAVAEQSIVFKANYYSRHQNEDGQVRCPLTGQWVTRLQAHVDHLPPLTFDVIIEDFIALQGLNINVVQVVESEDDGVGTVFVDQKLEADWCAYHKDHASFRVVSAFANLSVVPRAHNRAVRQMTLFDI